MASLLIKDSVNQSVDQMGFTNALASSFTMHQLNHSHWEHVTSEHVAVATPEFGVPSWRDARPPRPRTTDSAQAEDV
jgi:enoyl-CoA hydratase